MGRVALVTGGTRGIGRACSEALKEAGYDVAASYGGNEEAAQAFNAETGIPVYRWDIADPDASEAGIARVVDDLGPVEVLVNNAGVSLDKFFHKMPREMWDKTIDVNLRALYGTTHSIIGPMRRAGFGRIVNITSLNAFRGGLGETAYDATKAGLVGFTKALALESARNGITVNAVAPGYIDTDMVRVAPQDWLDDLVKEIPVGRLGMPEEVARCVTFLAADEAAFITGAVIDVNGGHYLR